MGDRWGPRKTLESPYCDAKGDQINASLRGGRFSGASHLAMVSNAGWTKEDISGPVCAASDSHPSLVDGHLEVGDPLLMAHTIADYMGAYSVTAPWSSFENSSRSSRLFCG